MQIRSSHRVPIGARVHLWLSLKWINAADLDGIGLIELMNQLPESKEESPEWHAQATAENLSVNGLYIPKKGDSPAKITLFTRDLYRGFPRFYWLTPALTIRFARTLFHEVGHHLLSTRDYVFVPGDSTPKPEFHEEMAHRYSFSVIKSMLEKWYYRLGYKACKNLAVWHYAQARMYWKVGNYRLAAERWYQSFHIDPDRHDSIYWYQRAKLAHKEDVRANQDYLTPEA